MTGKLRLRAAPTHHLPDERLRFGVTVRGCPRKRGYPGAKCPGTLQQHGVALNHVLCI